jgi:quercetin dioxygenase-like cupin family protein
MHTYKRYDSEKRLLSGPLLFFALEEEIEQLKKDPEWRSRHSNAVTLLKTLPLSVVLVVLQKGATLREHHTDSPITVLVLSGKISFGASGQQRHVQRHALVTLDKGIPHDVEALEDSAFLLTIVQPHPSEKRARKPGGTS